MKPKVQCPLHASLPLPTPVQNIGSSQQAAAKTPCDLPPPTNHVESSEYLPPSGPLDCFSVPGGRCPTVHTAALHLVSTLLQVWPTDSHSH